MSSSPASSQANRLSPLRTINRSVSPLIHNFSGKVVAPENIEEKRKISSGLGGGRGNTNVNNSVVSIKPPEDPFFSNSSVSQRQKEERRQKMIDLEKLNTENNQQMISSQQQVGGGQHQQPHPSSMTTPPPQDMIYNNNPAMMNQQQPMFYHNYPFNPHQYMNNSVVHPPQAPQMMMHSSNPFAPQQLQYSAPVYNTTPQMRNISPPLPGGILQPPVVANNDSSNSLAKISYQFLTPEQQREVRNKFYRNFVILKNKVPASWDVQIPGDDKSLEFVHDLYETYSKQVSLRGNTMWLKGILAFIFTTIEWTVSRFGGKYVDLRGYAICQMNSLDKYEGLLIEFCEKYFSSEGEGSQMSIEMRFFLFFTVQTAVFVGCNFLEKFTGSSHLSNILKKYVETNFTDGIGGGEGSSSSEPPPSSSTTNKQTEEKPSTTQTANNEGGFDMNNLAGLGSILGNLMGGGNSSANGSGGDVMMNCMKFFNNTVNNSGSGGGVRSPLGGGNGVKTPLSSNTGGRRFSSPFKRDVNSPKPFTTGSSVGGGGGASPPSNPQNTAPTSGSKTSIPRRKPKFTQSE